MVKIVSQQGNSEDVTKDTMGKENKEKVKNSEKDLFAGFDVGSGLVHYTVLTEGKEIIHSPEPIMHFADPAGAVKEAWQDIVERFGESRIKNTAFTGTGAGLFPAVMKGATFSFDSVAIPKGAEIIEPKAKYIFHIGAKDSYF